MTEWVKNIHTNWEKFIGVLRLISLDRRQEGRLTAFVECTKCGKKKTIRAYYLMSKKNNSCSCQHIKHDLSSSRIYGIYHKMKDRCYNANCCSYRNYGAKNIKVCDDWMDDNGFQEFYKWAMTHGYEDNLTIERIDSNQGYSPDNCEWITLSENVGRANKHNVRRRADKDGYKGISPSGEVFFFDNAAEFARNNPPLCAGCIRACAEKTKKTHHGWTFEHTNT